MIRGTRSSSQVQNLDDILDFLQFLSISSSANFNCGFKQKIYDK